MILLELTVEVESIVSSPSVDNVSLLPLLLLVVVLVLVVVETVWLSFVESDFLLLDLEEEDFVGVFAGDDFVEDEEDEWVDLFWGVDIFTSSSDSLFLSSSLGNSGLCSSDFTDELLFSPEELLFLSSDSSECEWFSLLPLWWLIFSIFSTSALTSSSSDPIYLLIFFYKYY